jgi:hypothetical protein
MSLGQGDPFTAADFSSEELGVYRAAGGKRLLVVRKSSLIEPRRLRSSWRKHCWTGGMPRDQIAIYSVLGN